MSALVLSDVLSAVEDFGDLEWEKQLSSECCKDL